MTKEIIEKYKNEKENNFLVSISNTGLNKKTKEHNSYYATIEVKGNINSFGQIKHAPTWEDWQNITIAILECELRNSNKKNRDNLKHKINLIVDTIRPYIL